MVNSTPQWVGWLRCNTVRAKFKANPIQAWIWFIAAHGQFLAIRRATRKRWNADGLVCCFADCQSAGARRPKPRLVLIAPSRVGNPRYGRLGSLRYDSHAAPALVAQTALSAVSPTASRRAPGVSNPRLVLVAPSRVGNPRHSRLGSLRYQEPRVRPSVRPIFGLQPTTTSGCPSTSIRGWIPKPGAVDAAMRPLIRCGAPVAVLTVT